MMDRQLRLTMAHGTVLVMSLILTTLAEAQPLLPPRQIDPATTIPAEAPVPLGLPDLIQISLERNPNLQQAGFDIDAARGRAVQAGLYPNPTVSVVGDELGGRNGPGGFITAPMVSQEIVTGGKLHLSRAVAGKEVDQASLALVHQRLALFTTVRQGYFEVLAAQRRVEILTELLRLATETFETTKKLLEAKQVAKLDLLQFQVERSRFQAELDASRRELTAAWRRLTANMGAPELPCTWLIGSLEAEVPCYDFNAVRAVMLEIHPDALSAEIAVEKARLALKRAQVEPVPNVTLAAGYTRDNIDKQNEWTFQVGVPIPVFNRNQGNIQAAQAELGRTIQGVSRAQNELTERLATAYGLYSAAQERARQYRRSILPDARDLYQLASEAFKGGQFEYLRVLQAQRAIHEANLEYLRSLAETWRAASEIAGLLLEEHWPGPAEKACNDAP